MGKRCGCYDDGHPCRCEPAMVPEGRGCCRGDDCAAGQECVTLWGLDPAGGWYEMCLIRCRSDFDCPGGRFCVRSYERFDPEPGTCTGGWD